MARSRSDSDYHIEMAAPAENSSEQLQRLILHADMDAFFASVEQRDDPSLRGKPVLVGGTGNRGVVTAASYEARQFGCRSAQPMVVARRMCPDAIVVKGRHQIYREVSRQVFAIFDEYTPLVQPLSIDEAFMDVTGSVRLFGSAGTIAETIRARVRGECQLTVSVGIAPNKFLAKLASDLEKPDGLVEIDPGRIHDVLDPLPVNKIWGVGKVSEKRLGQLGLRTIGDLRVIPLEVLAQQIGEHSAHRLNRLANGIDHRPVHSDSNVKSISHEQTFGSDLADPAAVIVVLMEQVDSVAERLRRAQRQARTVSLKIRFGNFETITRSMTLVRPTDLTTELREAARTIFRKWSTKSFRPVRLIGMGVSQFDQGDHQRQLFIDAERSKGRAVDQTLDAINQRFGRKSIHRGR